MSRLALVHGDLLIDRAALRAALPRAWGEALVADQGGHAEGWANAYRQIQDDWDSYWADLDLDSDDSLAQWREGRWRIVRGLFRLAGRAALPIEQMAYYLDEFPRKVGRICSAWQPGAAEALNRLAERGIAVVLLPPYMSSALFWGMLDALDRPHSVRRVLGPDELGQAGLEGIAPAHLARLAGADPAKIVHITQPDDLSNLIQQPHHRQEEP
jgi:hypothetical protein